VDTHEETVNLGILNAGEVVVINTVESPLGVRMSSKIGNRSYLHSTALGKCLLAGLPDKDLLRLLRVKGMPRLTPNTLVTKAELTAEIERVRKQGHAIDNEKNELDSRCIGAPVHSPDGRVLANGAQLGWLIDPDHRSVAVHRPGPSGNAQRYRFDRRFCAQPSLSLESARRLVP
jgi:IclR family transcriptional regulator, KDG regulon repressor